jgi:HPt (histidine-containing phosphotransfer) domain-containing protein
VERTDIEKEIMIKAKEWADDYGEDFLVELIDVYLDEAPARMAQLQLAVDGHDAETLSREAHTLKSSSANVGAMTLSAMAQQVEIAGRTGKTENLADVVRHMAATFAQVRTALEVLRRAPGEFIGEER